MHFHAGLDRVFHALADPTRRQILRRLERGDAPVMKLVRRFDLSQPAVTKHLNVLERAGLIQRSRHGRLRLCRLRSAAMKPAWHWIERYRQYWHERLDLLEEVLAGNPQPRESTDDPRK